MANQPHPSKQAVTWRLPRTLLDCVKASATERDETVLAFVTRALEAQLDEHHANQGDDMTTTGPGALQTIGFMLCRVSRPTSRVEFWDDAVHSSAAEAEAHARREGDPIGYKPVALVQVAGGEDTEDSAPLTGD